MICAWFKVAFSQQSSKRNNVQGEECRGVGVAPRRLPGSSGDFGRSSAIKAACTKGPVGHFEGTRTETSLPFMSFCCMQGSAYGM